jgi:2-polyprenyl-6-methoxyphenol hydroxylase-like FAD-dependent oxidoreductase
MDAAGDNGALVVGAGPAGLMAAVTLSRAGVKVGVLDQEERGKTHGYALALHPRSLELLDGLGLAASLVDVGQRIDRIAFYVGGERRLEVDLGGLDSPFPFALSLPQSTLEESLQRLARQHGVKISWHHRLARLDLEGPRPAATVDQLDTVSAGYPVASTSRVVRGSSRMTAGFVVGCDGHRSLVRRRLDGEFEHVADAAMFAVFEFASDHEPRDEMRVVLTEAGLSGALWPLPGGRFRWSFELGDPSPFKPRPDERRLVQRIGQAAYPEIAEERLADLIGERAPWFRSTPRDVLWSMAIRFERRVSSTMGRGRVWLAGDAAHTTLPIGMHSLNIGVVEAHAVARAIAEGVREGSASAAVEPYPPEHVAHLRQLLLPDEGFEAGQSADGWVRSHLAPIVLALPATGSALASLLEPLGISRRDAEGSLV